MSNFSYGKHTKKRIGVWLRHQSNPDMIKMISENVNKRIMDTVERVIISEYDKKTDEVWIEVWCKNFWDTFRERHRYNVFYLKTKVNEEWICEGDLGKGYKE